MSILSVTLAGAADLIRECGPTNTFIFQGEPGIGKSALLKDMGNSDAGQDFITVYIDCALLDLGDLQMPVPAEDRRSIGFVPNSMFKVDSKVPLIVMLDEIGKASRPVQNALLTLLHEHRIGNHHLPEGSIVFCTTNMASDGVGDNLQAHAKNRVTFMRIDKPTHTEWLPWAANNDVSPEVMAWVNENPHCLASYIDTEGTDNPYIFYPSKQQDAYFTPRSAFNASNIIKKRDKFSPSVLVAALAGTIGESAAKDMQAFISVADALPSWGRIIESPDTAPVSDNPIAHSILAMSAVMRITHTNIDAWMTYMGRLPMEVQYLFANQAHHSKNQTVLRNCRAYVTWALDHDWAS